MKKELILRGVGVVVFFAILTIVTAQLKEEPWRNPASLPKPNGKDAILIKTEREEGKSLILRYRMPELVLKEIEQDSIGKRMRVELGNAPLRGKEGEPVLPVIPIYFIIPEGKEIASINVQRDKKISLPLKYDIEYGRKPVPLVKDTVVKKAVPKEEIYKGDKSFPLSAYEQVTVQEKKGVKIGVVNLNPVVYFPKERRIESYKEIEVRIIFKDSQQISKEKLKVRMNSYEAKKLGVENPEELGDYEEEEKGVNKLNKTQQQMLLDPSESYQYVVITSEAIRDATTDVTIRDLVAYRQSKGITATIVTTEEIYANYSGIDDAEKIRNFIRDAYTNWETEYVVLGGDVNIIPVRYLYTDGEQLGSDLYYQCLDGSYN
ncbi:MAG: C25 family cysteine peptidase, partial [Chitinispirillaceae bacterium]|nr:C25 family cysteine peptidase [Chitinispirillaceae bacterium]